MGVVNTTYTFSGTDTITSAKLNNIIDDTTFTGEAIQGTTLQVVSPGKLAVNALGITSNELASGSVTPAKISTGGPSWTASSISLPNPTTITGNATVTGETTSTGALTVGTAKMDVPSGSAPIFGARAWVNFDADRDASGASNTSNTNRFIRASGNVSSVLKTGTGKFTVTMSTALPNVNYAVVGTAGDNGVPRFLGSAPSTQTTTQFFLTTDGQSGDVVNFSNNSLVVFG
jgi:hypothetical protein